jgi:hypothetical protein
LRGYRFSPPLTRDRITAARYRPNPTPPHSIGIPSTPSSHSRPLPHPKPSPGGLFCAPPFPYTRSTHYPLTPLLLTPLGSPQPSPAVVSPRPSNIDPWRLVLHRVHHPTPTPELPDAHTSRTTPFTPFHSCFTPSTPNQALGAWSFFLICCIYFKSLIYIFTII